MEKRVCIKCGKELPLNKDNFRFKGKVFLNTCRECEKEYTRNYHKTHKKEDRQYYLNNKEKIDKHRKDYYLKNKERENKRNRRWNQKNRDFYLEMSRKSTRKYRIKNNLITGKGQSIQENQIENYLLKLNIIFEKEKWFSDCRSRRNELLSFDFFLSELNIIIEYDGECHYKPIFGLEKLQNCKDHDQIKNDYCLRKDIRLIRISYKEDLYNCLNKIFEDEFARSTT